MAILTRSVVFVSDESGDLGVVVSEVGSDFSEELKLTFNEALGLGVVVLLNSAVLLVGSDELGVLGGKLGVEASGGGGRLDVGGVGDDVLVEELDVLGVDGEDVLGGFEEGSEDLGSGSGLLLVVGLDFEEGDSEGSEPLEESLSDGSVVGGEFHEGFGDHDVEVLDFEVGSGDLLELGLDEGGLLGGPVGHGLDGLVGLSDGFLGGGEFGVDVLLVVGGSDVGGDLELGEPVGVGLEVGNGGGGVDLLFGDLGDHLGEDGFLGLVEVLSLGESHLGDVASGVGLSPELVGHVELLSAVVDELVEEGEDSVESTGLLELHGHGGEHGFGSGVSGHFQKH